MWTNPPGSKQVEKSLERFIPPYCPNPRCICHQPERAEKEGRFFVFRGRRSTARFPYVNMRYECRFCFRNFSSSFFTLQYRDRLPDNYEKIWELHASGVTRRRTSRLLHCTEKTVRSRFSKLCRWYLLKHEKDLEKHTIKEAIVFDGLENFSYSQFDPNNINHAIGKDSLFTYGFSYSAINRKGRMTPAQKKKKQKLEDSFGPYPKGEIHRGVRRVFSWILEKTEKLTLYTDDHYAYRDVLKEKKFKHVEHFTTPSKKYRNYRNKLFAVNHLDMLSRHQLSAYKRETIAFSKHSIGMQESFVLLTGFKNYAQPKFVKKHKQDRTANTHSPAMVIGLAHKILSFKELFKTRITKAQVKLNEDMLHIFERRDPLSRRKILPYYGI